MGLLPLRGPPKPQPYENTKRFVRRCRSLFSSVLLSGAQGGSLSASHTNHPFVLQGVCPAGVGPGGQTIFILFQVDRQLAEKAALLRRAAGEQGFRPVRRTRRSSAVVPLYTPRHWPCGASRGVCALRAALSARWSGGFAPLRYAPAGAVATLFLRHSPRGLHFAAQRCMALPPPAFFPDVSFPSLPFSTV